VVEEIVTMLNRVCQGCSREDAVLVMASAYRSYAYHHRDRYWAFTRMSPGGRTRNSGGVSGAVARQPASALGDARGARSVCCRRVACLMAGALPMSDAVVFDLPDRRRVLLHAAPGHMWRLS